MTEYEKFQEKVKDGILAFMPDEYRDASTSIFHVSKNNGQSQAGVVIKREGQDVTPTIYLEPYYTEVAGGRSEQSVLKEIAEEYVRAQAEGLQMTALADSIKDYDLIRDKIRVQLVNKETNQERLKDCPNKEIQGTDLVAVFRVQLYECEREGASILVTDAMMRRWDTNLESLYKTALKNTVSQAPAQIYRMESMLLGEEDSVAPEDMFREKQEIYILTNPQKMNGASVLLYPGFLQTIAESSHSDFFILPSSLHEVLLIKREHGSDARELQRMVMEINRNVVDAKEVLSDLVYYYDGRKQSLSMAVSPAETEALIKDMEMIAGGYEEMEEENPEQEMER